MKSLSEDTFKSLAGDAAFARGLAYYNEGRVGELTIDKFRIDADVAGTEVYSVVLHHTAKLFEGECNCPASNNFDFCKHCVAVALSYYYQTQVNQELVESPESDLLADYLSTLTKPELVTALSLLINKDPESLDHWQLRAEIASGGLTSANIRKRITKAIPYKSSGLWRYRDVAMYFDEAVAALSVLDQPILNIEPENASKLVRYAAQRFEKTLETVDDSGGYRFEFAEMLQLWLRAVITANDWPNKGPVKFVTELLLDPQFSYEVFELETLIQSTLDQADILFIYQQIEKEWQTSSIGEDRHSSDYYRYQRLEGYLLRRARSQDDLAKELKILEKGAETIERCIELANFCYKRELNKDASKWLRYAEGMGDLSIRDIYAIESIRINLYRAEGQIQPALDLLWARFEEQEGMEQIRDLIETASAVDQQQLWLGKCINLLKQRFDRTDRSYRSRMRVETLVKIYLEQNQYDRAVALTNTNLLQSTSIMAIVNASPVINSATFALIKKATNLHLNITGKTVYQEAIMFLESQQQRLAPTQHEDFEKALKEIFSDPKNLRKTGFVKLLKNAFPKNFS